jgi:hypothetical protein
MKIIKPFVVTLILSGSYLQTVSAHDFWIEVDDFTPAEEQQVNIRLKEGVGFRGNTLPYIEEWFSDFSATTVAGTEPVLSLTGNDPAAEVVATEGQLLLGYQSIRSFVELDADKFNLYLEHEGIEFIRAARIAAGEDDQPAPEYFIRCAKTLLNTNKQKGFWSRFSSSAADNPVYSTKLGYTLELIPLTDPYEVEPGDSLSFELIYRDSPASDLLVQAFTKEEPEQIQKIRTDAQGRATLTFDKSGTWMVKAVQIQSIIGDPKARWQSYWATYLFTVD